MDAMENTRCVRRSKEEKKLLQKQIKASHTLLKHEGISTVSQPTKSLVVANGGLGSGVSREQLLAALQDIGEVEALAMPPHKPYAFVTYRSEESARKAHAVLKGRQWQSGENAVTLYLSYVHSVPCSEAAACVSLPDGLVLVEDFVSREEEASLLSAVDWTPTDEDSALKHRVKHFGYSVDEDKPLSAGMPAECVSILERCVRDEHVDATPDQMTVTQCQSAEGIPPHVDTHSAFEDNVMSLNLGAEALMEFCHPDGRAVAVAMPERSLLVRKGESRYLWTHGMTPGKFDPKSKPATPSDLSARGHVTSSKRGVRTSFTFRKIRHAPCRCAFPSTCDSQRATPPPLPLCHGDAVLLEELYVHHVYDAIAAHFSSTRHSPWPRVCRFLHSLAPGAVLADVGCGNGKYLAVNPEVVAVGCDRSAALVRICAQRGHRAFVSDALSVPLRAASCDACISIAVIHHFSTRERRLAAVRELVRLLRPGGRALIYVWALEQERNKQRSKYLKEHAGNRSPTEHTPHHDGQVPSNGRLSVHTNRTSFNSQDLLVPWHLKDGRQGGVEQNGEQGQIKAGPTRTSHNSSTEDHQGSVLDSEPNPGVCSSTHSSVVDSKCKSGPGGGAGSSPALPVFHRYYHVFQQGELEELCGGVAGVQIQTSYHDEGNWCVILEKD